ncbi:MAG: Pr6Pr family membrane protein [Jatrophihabitantaceae bacterium]
MTLSMLTRCWYALLACVITVPIVGTLVLIIRADRSIGNFFSYFTVQSNVLTLAVAVLLVISPQRASDAFQLLRIGALTGITVTGLVYGGLIAPYVHPKGIERLYDTLFHYISPAMAVVGFFVLLPRARFSARHLWFIAWPLCWLGYTLVRAAVSQPDYPREDGTFAKYPYDFLDVDLHGWGTVVGFIAAITVLLLAVASIYLWLSRRLAPDQP